MVLGIGKFSTGIAVRVLCLLTAACASCSLADVHAADDAIKSRYAAFEKQVEAHDRSSHRAFTRHVDDRYQEGFGDRVRKLDEEVSVNELQQLFDAATLACFYSAQIGQARDMQRILDRLIEKSAATEQHFSRMFDAYVQVRLFAEAAEIQRLHGTASMAPLPKFDDLDMAASDAPTELIVDVDRRLMTRQIAVLPSDPYILVAAHPQCHFTHNAFVAIAADVELSTLFRVHAKWLKPPGMQLEFDAVQNWNSHYPDAPMTIAWRSEEWSLVDSWGTPTFYFIRDGKVSATVTGWPTEGRTDELRAAARSIGLLTTPVRISN